jgi:DNA-binding transcriptional regulator YiaG
MTPDELAEAAHTLGLTNSDLALIMGNTLRAVQYWQNGRSPIPQTVAIILNAMLAGQIDLDWLTDEVSRQLQQQTG